MNAFLAVVQLPIPDTIGQSPSHRDRPIGAPSDLASKLMLENMSKHNLIAAIFSYRGYLHVRLSTQCYNRMSDYERFADLISDCCQKLGVPSKLE
jgi:hypothetical protein